MNIFENNRYVAFLHGRKSTHTDRIQDEKGRDVSITSTAVFTAKLAQGKLILLTLLALLYYH
jgi:hypothetical protein